MLAQLLLFIAQGAHRNGGSQHGNNGRTHQPAGAHYADCGTGGGVHEHKRRFRPGVGKREDGNKHDCCLDGCGHRAAHHGGAPQGGEEHRQVPQAQAHRDGGVTRLLYPGMVDGTAQGSHNAQQDTREGGAYYSGGLVATGDFNIRIPRQQSVCFYPRYFLFHTV